VKKQFRLRKSSDFQRVRQHGRAFAHPLVVLFIQPNELEFIRIGITTGKSIGNAVQRNRAKRVLKAAIAELAPQIQPGFDLVLQARRAANSKSSNELRQTIFNLLEKAELLRK